jgi:hypothetical protein
VAQGVDPEFKPQYCKKRKKERKKKKMDRSLEGRIGEAKSLLITYIILWSNL